MRITKSEREAQKIEAIETLQSLLSAGSTVYTVLSSVSRSGMSRTIKCLYTRTHADDETNPPIRNISRLVADATGSKMSKDGEGVIVGGCGMDMGFHLVNILDSALRSQPETMPHRASLKQEWV